MLEKTRNIPTITQPEIGQSSKCSFILQDGHGEEEAAHAAVVEDAAEAAAAVSAGEKRQQKHPPLKLMLMATSKTYGINLMKNNRSHVYCQDLIF